MTTDDRQPVLSKSEMATTYRVSQRTIANWVRHRGLPCVRIGGRILFPTDRVRDWFDAQATGGGQGA